MYLWLPLCGGRKDLYYCGSALVSNCIVMGKISFPSFKYELFGSKAAALGRFFTSQVPLC